VALIAALASDVELLLLDEPTAGLDPLMEAEFRRALGALRDQGRTALLSSHILSEVEAACERVTIVRAGRAVESGAIAELRHLTQVAIVAELAGPPPPGLDRVDGVHDLAVDADTVRCHVDPGALDGLLRRLTDVGIRSLESRPPTLEEMFLRFYAPEATEVPEAPELPGAGTGR
jgi:ABC-2 type transport system ATP-binding protein